MLTGPGGISPVALQPLLQQERRPSGMQQKFAVPI
jgi:hypothetical protein